MPSHSADLTEDLIRQAEFGFRTAMKSCGDCIDYHALFGYGRLTRVNNGMRTDGDTIVPLLARMAKPGLRVLIAGAADAGLLALTARGVLGSGAKITVADRCSTPLAVCRRYAEARGFEIETVRIDLSAVAPPGEFDAILVHNVLWYIPKSLHAAFLRNLGSALSSGGTFLLVCRVPEPGAEPYRKVRGDMPTMLAEKGIALPEDAEAMRARTVRMEAAEHARLANIPNLAEIEASLAASGLRIRERVEHAKRVTPEGMEKQAQRMTTQMFLLSRTD